MLRVVLLEEEEDDDDEKKQNNNQKYLKMITFLEIPFKQSQHKMNLEMSRVNERLVPIRFREDFLPKRQKRNPLPICLDLSHVVVFVVPNHETSCCGRC